MSIDGMCSTPWGLACRLFRWEHNCRIGMSYPWVEYCLLRFCKRRPSLL